MDKQKWHQLLMELHDQGKIDCRKLLEEMGLNYDEEVKLLRKIQNSGE